MGYGSIAGRARTSANNPRAHAICDKCGFRFNHIDLQWQYDWRGASLQNLKLLVCRRCCDSPQQQLRSFVVPADPTPIINPRVEPFIADSVDARQVSGYNSVDPVTNIPIPGGEIRITQEDEVRTTQQTGEAPGGLNEQPGTDPTAPVEIGGNPGLPYEFDEIPETGPLNGE